MSVAAKHITGVRLLAALIVLIVAGAIYFATRAPGIDVEIGRVTRGPLAVTVDDLAETRVRDLYMVSAPTTGELLRVPLKPGARVIAGQTLLARVRPLQPGPLDARSVAQIEANVATLQAQAAAAAAQVESARAGVALSQRQLDRISALQQRGFATQATLDQAQAERDQAKAGWRAADQAAQAARAAVHAAGAGLMTDGGTGRGLVDVRSPVSGFVLTVPQESMRVVTAGTPLLAVGDPAQLEMVTDLLSSDAVQVRPGAEVSIEDWGGDHPLKGRVRLVEPFGFLKVSALGVEEQRVNVVIDLAEPRAAWARLGHGFRATVRITTWSAAHVLRVPVGALFRSGDAWQVFRVSSDWRARTVTVKVGRMNAEMAELVSGLSEGDLVILHPGDRVAAGRRVLIRR